MTQTRYTVTDLASMPEDGKRRELLNGELVILDSSSPDHQTIIGNVLITVEAFLRQHRLGRVFLAPVDVVLEIDEVLVPDLVFVSTERLGIVKKRIEGAPDWVVEVLSESTRRRDLHQKRDLYSRHGVRTYWVIDPEGEEVRVWENGDGPTIFERGATLSVSSLPGFELSIEEVFNLEY
jgi:Uma2 family endonuclease